MKLRHLSLALVCALPAAAAAETVTILHVNDIHSRIEPITKYDNTCAPEDDAEGKCFGGSARLATAVKAARAAAEGPLLLLDGGDEFQGSLFFTHYKGKVAAEMMNAIGFDAMVVGNHEFDDGPETLKTFVDAVSFPVVSANLDIAANSPIAGAVPASSVIEKGGYRYGIIGITAQDTAELSSPGDTITFTDPAEAVRAEVAKLTADGVNRIIVLSHSGIHPDEGIATIDGVDLVVGGHTNTLLSNTVEGASGPYPEMIDGPDGPTPVVQAGAYGRYLGTLALTFDDDGKVTKAEGNPLLLDASIEKDPKFVERIVELAGPLEAIRTEVVGETAAAIDGSRETCRAMECPMGDLVADAMLDRTAAQGVTIAIQNGGGLRASIDEGPITMGDVLTVLPFQNTLATFELTGAGVVAALENGVSQIEDGGGRFPQVAGIRYTADKSVPAGEGRIKSVEVKDGESWAPLDPEKTYLVVSNNFMRQGGDGYSVFETEGVNAYDYGPGLEDVVAEYLTKLGAFTPETDGRVTVR